MKDYIQNYINLIESTLENYLQGIYPIKLWQAMHYSVMAGGKRLRPMLVLESAKVCGADINIALPTACALEMLHTYSLIHDDLPCMDNDDFRRGKPTNHKVFGEAMAVLAGDGLLSIAPQIILTRTPKTVHLDILNKVLEEFFIAIGPDGMLGGQVVDILSENQEIDLETFKYIHTHKTGKLFEFALRSGAILAKADDKKLSALTRYAQMLGYAFQVADDILDEEASFEQLGKTPHKDADAHKNTHPSMFGIKNSKIELKELCDEAKNILQQENIQSDLFYYVVQGLTDKIKGE